MAKMGPISLSLDDGIMPRSGTLQGETIMGLLIVGKTLAVRRLNSISTTDRESDYCRGPLQYRYKFGFLLLVIATILLLSPYLSGHDLGVIKIPKLERAFFAPG